MIAFDAYFDPEGPGAAAAVAVDGRPPVIACAGFADIETREPITPETPFDLASASKTFTAAAILMLEAEQRLDLRLPVSCCLEDWVDAPGVRPVEVRDLLWHASGLHDYLERGMYTPADEMTPAFVRAQFPHWSREAVPGKVHEYSNTNYFCLARIVEAVAGVAFSTFVASRLFEPFGLEHTGTGRDARRAAGYRNAGSGLPRFVKNEAIEPGTDGDGGVVSSLDDLLRWHLLFWNGGIVGEALVRRMCERGRLDSGERFEYGFGLQIEAHGDRLWCGHTGSWVDSTVVVGRHVKERATVIVLSNEFMAPVERIAQRAGAFRRDPRP